MRLKAFCVVILMVGRLLGGTPGMPRVRAYLPKDYGAEAQNWALAQDGRGVLHVANNLGILSFDGARWSLLPTPGQNVVRSLAVDAQGRVHVGAVGEVGLLVPGQAGRLAFTSLTDRLPLDARRFSDVWACHATAQGVLFQSREQLMLWDGRGFRVWKARTSFHQAFLAAGRVLVRERERGLMELTPQGPVLLDAGERFAQESVWAALPTQAGIVVVSRNLGLWRLQGSRLTPMDTPVAGWLKEQAVYTGLALRDGTLALGSLKGGVALVDPEGHLVGVLDRASGLPSENVKRMLVDREGCLWLALDHGVARVAWPSALTLADVRTGLRGTVWGLHRHEGRLYAATGQGAAILDPAAPAFRPRWIPIEGLAVQCIGFLSVGRRLLMATAQGVVELRDTRAVPVRVSSQVAIALAASRRFPGRIYLGLQGGLCILGLRDGRWVDEGLVPGVTEDCYNLLEDASGALWIGTAAGGVLRVRFQDGAPPEVRSYGAAEGLGTPVQPLVFPVQDGIAVGSRSGIQRYDPATDRWRMDPAFGSLVQDGGLWVKAVRALADGRIWFHLQVGNRRLTGVARPDGKGRYAWDDGAFRSMADTPVECFLEDPDGTAWIGGPEGLACWDPRRQEAVVPLPPPLLQRVLSARGTFLLSPGQPVDPPREVASADGSLRFEFALPSFLDPEANRYQTWLEGIDRGWGPWTPEAQKEYTRLREGAYRFRVRGMDASGIVSSEAAFPFRVRPPWQRTWWSRALLVLAAGIGALGFLRWRLRWLERRNEELQRRVAAATAQLQAQAAELARLNEEKNHFIGMVAHDLRNPLNAVLLTSGMLEEGLEDESQRRWARLVGQESREMAHLVEHFLDLAAIDSGKVVPKPGRIQLLLPLHQLVARYQERAERKGQVLITDFPETDTACDTDLRFLRAVVDNLLSNALKFSPRGGKVTLRVAADALRIRIQVEDQGPGFSEEDRARLFMRFQPLSARPTGGEKSTGLGLSIVKRFVDALHGTVSVESSPGQGATFTVELPRDWPA